MTAAATFAPGAAVSPACAQSPGLWSALHSLAPSVAPVLLFAGSWGRGVVWSGGSATLHLHPILSPTWLGQHEAGPSRYTFWEGGGKGDPSALEVLAPMWLC